MLPSNVKDFKYVIILKHPSHTLKTAVINKVMERYKDNELEILLSPKQKEYLDGVIIRDKKTAMIIDDIATPNLPGAIEIDLNLFISEQLPNDLDEQKEKIQEYTNLAYDDFQTGLKIHDDLEAIYINEMDFQKADELADNFIEKLLENVPKTTNKGNAFYRLFGTNTADGVVNEVPHIINQVSKAYYIKGRAGTGKSTFMKKIAEACMQHGYDIEQYHCSFDPGSIDMILVRELDFCIFDSTDPHEFSPERDQDEIIDLYEIAVTPGTDEKYEKEIEEVTARYKSYMKNGIKNIKKAGEYLEAMEQQFHIKDEDIKNVTEFITKKAMVH
ncbi:PRK06851 family protein [Virgibacillus kimchii]